MTVVRSLQIFIVLNWWQLQNNCILKDQMREVTTIWEFFWLKWHQNRFFPVNSNFSPVNVISPILHTHSPITEAIQTQQVTATLRDTTKRKQQTCHFPVSVFHCVKCCAACNSQVKTDNCVNYWRVKNHRFNETTLPEESTVYFPKTSSSRFRMITADGPEGLCLLKMSELSPISQLFQLQGFQFHFIHPAGYSVKSHYRTAYQDSD